MYGYYDGDSHEVSAIGEKSRKFLSKKTVKSEKTKVSKNKDEEELFGSLCDG